MRATQRVLLVPSARRGDGIGHLRRCLELVRGFPNGAVLFDPNESGTVDRIRTVAAATRLNLPERRLISELRKADRWELIILDRRATSVSEYLRYSNYGTTVGIDEGGDARELMPYLIDTLPLPAERSKANVYSPGFQLRPSRRRGPDDPESGRVLITFGGEDPKGLSAKLVRALIDERCLSASQISVVVGPLFRAERFPAGVETLHAPPDLRDRLSDFDVVFTSFGLTAYEALNAGVSTVLLNPTSYHRTLSRIAGFPEIGVSSVNRSALRRMLSDRRSLRALCSTIATDTPRSISDHIASLDFGASSNCPVCGEQRNRSIGRFADRSFFRCGRCSMVYELDFSLKSSRYDRAYFFEDYRKQYGKTYVEDFQNIRLLAESRIGHMRGLGFWPSGLRLLDVGCAFGPFLVEAAEQGAEVFGVDIAEEAVEYVTRELHLPSVVSPLEELDLHEAFGIETVDIVTMWYVIEHFPQLGVVLSKVNRLLPLGGMFAFSTPNLSGVSGRNDFEAYLSRSPHDHVTLWDPRIARAVLERYGFQVREVHITGHHPERFRIPGSTSGWRYQLLRRYSELARLGDTFECYAVKVSEKVP